MRDCFNMACLSSVLAALHADDPLYYRYLNTVHSFLFHVVLLVSVINNPLNPLAVVNLERRQKSELSVTRSFDKVQSVSVSHINMMRQEVFITLNWPHLLHSAPADPVCVSSCAEFQCLLLALSRTCWLSLFPSHSQLIGCSSC